MFTGNEPDQNFNIRGYETVREDQKTLQIASKGVAIRIR